MSDYDRAMASRRVGDTITVFIEDSDGSQQLVRPVHLSSFPQRELLRLFWLPVLQVRG